MKILSLLIAIFSVSVAGADGLLDFGKHVVEQQVDRAVNPWICVATVEYCKAGDENCLSSQFDSARITDAFTIYQVKPHGRFADPDAGCSAVTSADAIKIPGGSQYRVTAVSCSTAKGELIRYDNQCIPMQPPQAAEAIQPPQPQAAQ